MVLYSEIIFEVQRYDARDNERNQFGIFHGCKESDCRLRAWKFF